MKNKITGRAFIGALAVLTSVAPLLSGTAQAKPGDRADNGKHLGWTKKTVVQTRNNNWTPGRYRTTTAKTTWKTRRPVGKWTPGRYRTNTPGRYRPSNDPLNHNQTTNRIGQLIDTNYYSSRSSAEAAANRSRRNGRTATVGYDAPGRRWVVRVYNR